MTPLCIVNTLYGCGFNQVVVDEQCVSLAGLSKSRWPTITGSGLQSVMFSCLVQRSKCFLLWYHIYAKLLTRTMSIPREALWVGTSGTLPSRLLLPAILHLISLIYASV